MGLLKNIFILLVLTKYYYALHISKKEPPPILKTCQNSYQKCDLGKPNMINIHIVPHTHDDLGWLETVEQYYYGERQTSVKKILTNTVNELVKDPKRRFVYVEMGFFWRWWNEQNEKVKEITRNLVNEGRLEFIIGGWAMNDEASTYYTDIIDQHTLGFQFIRKEFGECARPKVAWQIDPFGHSREQGSLFAQFGFDGLFQGRIDYQDFEYRGQQLTREMIWKASANLGDDASIFTGILPNGYGPPKGFCFDETCWDDQVLTEVSNVSIKVDQFLEYVLNEQSKVYKTKNLIMTMGSDFQYHDAKRWFDNLDILISLVNERQAKGSNVNVFYSTPSCYLYSLYKSDVTWPTKDDDFFPYADRPHRFWTGYFTSRATLKDYVRRTSNFYQIVRHLSAFARLTDASTKFSIQVLADAMGILQHHDAVSGTAQQHVTDDYAKKLSNGTALCMNVIEQSFLNIATKRTGESFENMKLNFHYCPLLNISECIPIEKAKNFTMLFYNPLGREVETWIRVPVIDTTFKVFSLETFQTIKSDYAEIYQETKKLPERKSLALYELVFNVKLPPLGFGSYIAIGNRVKNHNFGQSDKFLFKNNDFLISNEYLSVMFDSQGNLLKIENFETQMNIDVTQKFCYYKSFAGYNAPDDQQASGAYVFRPDGSEVCLSVKQFTFKPGDEYSEIHQIYNEWISQTIRLYNRAKYIEFDWQVGSIFVDDGVGKEVVSRFNTNINSGNVFYTDSNGREILKRVKDYRPSWHNFNQTEPIAGNYYPINSRIFIRDSSTDIQKQFTIVNDRSQGGASLQSGSVEIMVHRRNLRDDSLGVSEALNERGSDYKGLKVKGKHFVFLDSSINSGRLHREMALEVNNRPLVMFGLPKSETDYRILRILGGWSALKNALPKNVHLLTLMHDYSIEENNALIIRLEHFYERNEDSEYSHPVTVNLIDLLSPAFKIVNIEEMALGANMKVTDLNERLVFKGQKDRKMKEPLEDPLSILLNPMEIRTFRVWYSLSPKSGLVMD